MRGTKLHTWKWLRLRLRWRLTPKFSDMFFQSAAEHGIKLTASFRPFEPALTKYYEVPAFDSAGRWLWGFLPEAWPTVNSHPERVCFANFRTILQKIGRVKGAEPRSIEFTHVQNSKRLAALAAQIKGTLRIVASHWAPIAPDSFVLVQQTNGTFTLKRYRMIAQQARKRQVELSGFKMVVQGDRVRIDNLRVPPGYRFLIIARKDKNSEMIQASVGKRIVVRAQAGNTLGRVNVYGVLDRPAADAAATRVAGISADGGYRTTFQAITNSIDRLGKNPSAQRLAAVRFVVDLGADWSVEMLDFQRQAARHIAAAQLKTFLAYPACDEIFINTRSHTQLAGTMADDLYGAGGVKPLAHYRLRRRPYRHLGIDLAFAPISLASNRRIMKLAANPQTIDRITDWQDNEWIGPCQSPQSPFVWRYERNRAVATGVRQLLQDLERTFPGVRIRAVIPPSEKVIRAVKKGLAQLRKPGGGVYGPTHFRHIRGSLNHIPAIGEGMAMVDLSGTSVEPAFLGIRFAPAEGPLKLYLRECFRDLADNRGSNFRGPRSFFYEAQETMRVKDRKAFRKKREQIICNLLSHRKEIKEVLLYEAADWTYFLPLSDQDLCGHGFLDRCRRGK